MVKATLERHRLIAALPDAGDHGIDRDARRRRQRRSSSSSCTRWASRIAIDDFGTGYSSLLYLKRLPASELKIDRGFVRNLAHDSEDRAIVSAIVALGQTLDLKIVAEGVETAAQQEFLTDMGCHSLQGFLFGKPMPPVQFLAALTHHEALFRTRGLGLAPSEATE